VPWDLILGSCMVADHGKLGQLRGRDTSPTAFVTVLVGSGSSRGAARRSVQDCENLAATTTDESTDEVGQAREINNSGVDKRVAKGVDASTRVRIWGTVCCSRDTRLGEIKVTRWKG